MRRLMAVFVSTYMSLRGVGHRLRLRHQLRLRLLLSRQHRFNTLKYTGKVHRAEKFELLAEFFCFFSPNFGPGKTM